jgi:hypothetical protein
MRHRKPDRLRKIESKGRGIDMHVKNEMWDPKCKTGVVEAQKKHQIWWNDHFRGLLGHVDLVSHVSTHIQNSQ